MPPQHRIGGRPVNFWLPPRRFVVVIGLVTILAVLLISSSSSNASVPSVPSVADLSEKAHHAAEILPKPHLPHLYNPFADAAHEPPEQADSSHGETKWYSDLKWLNPFSSVVTLDENRSVLPPLPPRTPIYTFYDASGKDSRTVDAENGLLLTWRRAWWAQGFRPIVLGRAEASKHPLHHNLQNLEPSLRTDVERYLAWCHMGGNGLLANWLVLPMGAHDDPTLEFLRRGDFGEKIVNFKGMKAALLAGKNANHIVERALAHDTFKKAPTLFDSITEDTFDTRDGQGLAFYDLPTINNKYKVVTNQLASSQAAGLNVLRQLINAHLHTTWQASFPGGIAILQPHPKHTTALVSYAARLAHELVQCPNSPMPATCPPNRPDCKTCVAQNSNIHVTSTEALENKTTVFTIGTVPHPFTFNSMIYSKEILTPRFIRRDAGRDTWLAAATERLLGEDLGGPQRLPAIKNAVAGPFAIAHSVWVVPELDFEMDRDFVFGFQLSKDDETEQSHGITEISESRSRSSALPPAPELADQIRLLREAKEKLKRQDRPEVDMLEAWNMADAEIWRFVRAFATRRRMERLRWEEEEKSFAGSEGTHTGVKRAMQLSM